jgi:hypothetical protein
MLAIGAETLLRAPQRIQNAKWAILLKEGSTGKLDEMKFRSEVRDAFNDTGTLSAEEI